MPRRLEYLNKILASKRSGLSVRRLLELAHQGKIGKIYERDPKTKRKIALFSLEDLRTLKQGRLPAPANLQISRSGEMRLAALPHPESSASTQFEDQATKLFLTISEAADYSGLPESFLEKLIDNGKIAAFDTGPRPGGRYRIAKRAIEQLAWRPDGIAAAGG